MQTRTWKNFTLDEFKCRCCGVADVTHELVDTLQAIRTGVDLPMHVLSGYRCPLHNLMVGGATKSMHIYGKAADIRAEAGTPFRDKLLAEAGRCGIGGIGLYPHFVHLDLGERRFWVSR